MSIFFNNINNDRHYKTITATNYVILELLVLKTATENMKGAFEV